MMKLLRGSAPSCLWIHMIDDTLLFWLMVSSMSPEPKLVGNPTITGSKDLTRRTGAWSATSSSSPPSMSSCRCTSTRMSARLTFRRFGNGEIAGKRFATCISCGLLVWRKLSIGILKDLEILVLVNTRSLFSIPGGFQESCLQRLWVFLMNTDEHLIEKLASKSNFILN